LNLLLGLPHPSTFPFYNISVKVKNLSDYEKPLLKNNPDSNNTEIVSIPSTPQVDKIENISASLQVS
jgi:hypothetical protein